MNSSNEQKEIGSEFWSIPVCENKNSLFPFSTKWFLSGRTALKYIIEDCDIKSVSMPFWCCESMYRPFEEYGVSVHFYDVQPSVEYDAVFLIDYFGFDTDSHISDDYNGIVIRDITHSLLSRQYNDADYYFGSLRKWAGFYTGGFAWGKWKNNRPIPPCNDEYVSLRKQAMSEKEQFIYGLSTSKGYLEIYAKANNMLNYLGICAACKDDIQAATHLDIDFIKKRRRENASILINHFKGLYELTENDCPLFVPIEVDNRDALRKYLINNGIYLPVHWPGRDLGGKELSLVCDQRYDAEDMIHICKVIEDYLKEGNEI